MQSSRSKSRKFLLDQLPNLEASSWDAIIWHLFERNDRISTSVVNITACYKEARAAGVKKTDKKPAEKKTGNYKPTVLEQNCTLWADAAAEMVNQLCEDMKLAQIITYWDEGILENMLRLIGFLLDGSGAWKDLISTCESRPKKEEARLQVRVGYQETYKEFADDLTLSLGRMKNEQISLLYHLQSDNSNVKDYTSVFIKKIGESKIFKIPIVILRELFVSNKAYQRREEIWRRVDPLCVCP